MQAEELFIDQAVNESQFRKEIENRCSGKKERKTYFMRIATDCPRFCVVR